MLGFLQGVLVLVTRHDSSAFVMFSTSAGTALPSPHDRSSSGQITPPPRLSM
jgi:hypothetical protein